MTSTAIKPILCRLAAYFEPGLPSPTMINMVLRIHDFGVMPSKNTAPPGSQRLFLRLQAGIGLEPILLEDHILGAVADQPVEFVLHGGDDIAGKVAMAGDAVKLAFQHQ